MREHREWTTEEVVPLIECGYALNARPDARAEYGLAIEMKLRTGARLGELLGGRYGDIDHEHGIWDIRVQWTRDGQLAPPKTKKSTRRVPLAPELLRKIAARKLRTGPSDEDFLFASDKGRKPISHENFRRRGWEAAVKLAGLTDGVKVTPHDARHAFASEMADSAWSPDLPGCVATGGTLEVAERELREAIAFHLEGLAADGMPLPEPSGPGVYIERTAESAAQPTWLPRWTSRLSPLAL